jgi:prepilin-type N-terminal cleavage/methylation domain-containing protein
MKRLMDNKGFTLIEILIVISIVGSVFGAMSMTLNTIYRNYNVGFDKSLALKQVDLASIIISKDINRAKTVGRGLNNGFPLTLTCYDWDDPTMPDQMIDNQVVIYDINGSTITRKVGAETAVIIARYIPPSPPTKIEGCTSSENYTCTITIYAKYNNASENGTYKAQQRVPKYP